MFTLQILHASDLEGGVDAIGNAPNFAAIVEALEADAAAGGFSSILLSAGDNYIPGPFFNASAAPEIQPALQAAVENLYGLEAGSLPGIEPSAGRIDVTIANILGIDASALGNHEFDAGTATVSSIIAELAGFDEDGEFVGVDGLEDVAWIGADFPYLSANLDFGDVFFTPATVPGSETGDIVDSTVFARGPQDLVDSADENGGFPVSPTVAPATIVEVDGEQIGVIGATTQLLESISSPGDVEVIGPNENDMEALAAILQPYIDELTAAGVDKIVTVSHLQQFALEQELAGLLSGVDVMIAGGSDTIVADETDRLLPGDEAGVDSYPFVTEDADGNPVAIVSTDGQYSYVGRLVIEFDENGNIVPESVDADQSGAYATDEQGVLDVTGAATLEEAIAGSAKATEIAALTGAVQGFVDELAADAPGFASVYLDGRRSEVRTEETNLGNLTAEANLFAARQADPTVAVSIKNGGGIRDDIGDIVLDNDGNPSFEPPFDNAVTVLDIQNSLRFDNTLAVLDLSSEDLKTILEHAVAGTAEGSTPGQFPQVAGVRFSVDVEGTALELDEEGNVVTEGSRIQSVALIDNEGNTLDVIVEDGEVVEGAPESIRVTTLNFLAGGGDSYPFPQLGENTLFVTEGFGLTADSEAEDLLGEQAALAGYLADEFGTEDAAYALAELDPALDTRIQFLDQRSDTVAAPEARDELTVELLTVFAGVEEPGEGNAEVVSHSGGSLYVTNGEEARIDVFDVASGETGPSATLDLSFIEGFDGVQSVAAGGGVVVAVADVEPTDGVPNNGVAAIFDMATLELVATVETGNLPDGVAISPDGNTVAIANEGEFNGESGLAENAPGSITLIDLSGDEPVANTIGFDGVDASGLRQFPGIDAALDIEPEYPVFSPDGSTVWVSLQEANGFAAVDVATGTIAALVSAGTVDHSAEGSGFDATDDEVIDILPRDTLGLRMPDAIASFETGGVTYYASANEGDGRGDITDGDDGVNVDFADEARVGDLLELGLLDPEAFPQVQAADDLPMEEAQEVADTPVPDTDATGSIDAVFDPLTSTLTVTGTFSDLSAPLFPVGGEDAFGNPESAIHVHMGAAGENGGIVFNTTVEAAEDGLSGSFEGSAVLSEEDAAAALAGGLYVNLHTEAFNGGELRGQIEGLELELVDDSLSRLTISTIDGDTDGDGDIDVLHSFGSRSFTIFDSAGNVVFDSGDEFETIIANVAPERFNDDDGELGQNRSDAKGPEPEAIAVGEIGSQTYAFIGAERDSGVFVYNVTDPADARFVTYIDGFATGNISPETIAFIPADESATGNAQIAVAHEVSGTTALYDLSRLESDVTTEDFYQIALGRTVDIAGYDFWSDILDIASDSLLAEAFEVSNEFQGLIGGLEEADAINFVFNNAIGRDATEDEAAVAASLVAEDGYSELFLAFLGDDGFVG